MRPEHVSWSSGDRSIDHCQCPDSLALHPGASQFIPFCKSRLKFHSYSKAQVEHLVTHKSHHHSLNGSFFALYVFISLVSLYTFFLSSRVSLLIFIQDISPLRLISKMSMLKVCSKTSMLLSLLILIIGSALLFIHTILVPLLPNEI